MQPYFEMNVKVMAWWGMAWKVGLTLVVTHMLPYIHTDRWATMLVLIVDDSPGGACQSSWMRTTGRAHHGYGLGKKIGPFSFSNTKFNGPNDWQQLTLQVFFDLYTIEDTIWMSIKLGLERSHRGSGCSRGEGAEKQDTIHELHMWITTACVEVYKRMLQL